MTVRIRIATEEELAEQPFFRRFNHPRQLCGQTVTVETARGPVTGVVERAWMTRMPPGFTYELWGDIDPERARPEDAWYPREWA